MVKRGSNVDKKIQSNIWGLKKKSPEYFVGSKKGRTFALAFGKNLRASIEIDH